MTAPNMTRPAGQTVAYMPMTSLTRETVSASATMPFPLRPFRYHRSKLWQMARDFCEEHGVQLRDLRGPSRERWIAWPRQDFMLRAYEAGYSYPRIARFLGNRDHTTIMHGVKAAERRRTEGGQG
jgi:chromosomal replication initiation ATPase DnaA